MEPIHATPAEQTEAYLDALETEAAGYEARAKGARDAEDKKAWDDRAKQCRQEITRAKKEGQTPKAKRDAESE